MYVSYRLFKDLLKSENYLNDKITIYFKLQKYENLRTIIGVRSYTSYLKWYTVQPYTILTF